MDLRVLFITFEDYLSAGVMENPSEPFTGTRHMQNGNECTLLNFHPSFSI